MLSQGEVVDGRYQVERLLGSGGMGHVYLVTHLKLKKHYALKALQVLSGDPGAQQQYLEQFESEAQLVANLNHPSLAAVTDFFEHKGTHFLVMEFIEGRTLSDVVRLAPRPISQRRVLQWADELLDTLEYLHSQQPPVIIRDLKPDNVMLTRVGRLKLIDFGIAKRLLPGNPTRDIVKGVGTEEYAPLEQYGAGGTDKRSDIYSFGATLLFLLSGEPPEPAWKRASQGAPLQDPRIRNPTVTEPVWEALQKIAALKREDRPNTVAEVRALLGQAAQAAPQGAPVAGVAAPSSGTYRFSSGQIAHGKVQVRTQPPQASSVYAAYGIGGHSRPLRLVVREAIRVSRCQAPVYAVAFSPSHGVLAIGSNVVHLWDVGRDKLWQKLWRGEEVSSLAFSTDGRLLAAGSLEGTVKLWEVSTGRPLRTLASRALSIFADRVRGISFSYGGRMVAAASDVSNVRTWEVSSGEEKHRHRWHSTSFLSRFQCKSLSVAFSSRNQLAAGATDGSVSVWDAASGKELFRRQPHSGAVNTVCFSPDGNFIATGSSDGTAALWGPDFKQLHQLTTAPLAELLSVSFSHDGRLLAAGCRDGSIYIWDMAQGQRLERLMKHTGSVNTVCFAPARRYLASGSSDQSVRLWKLEW
ncbi:MAG: serine/threonine protein kinase [Armatimonadetes bacterium]|nr:serine/threonine protein kinase [Armatimonadota bacterium]